jgi:hypothetical protein
MTPTKIVAGVYYVAIGNLTHYVHHVSGSGTSAQIETEIVRVGSWSRAGDLGRRATTRAGTLAKLLIKPWHRRCRVCRCSDERACESGCSWLSIDLCNNDDDAHRNAPATMNDDVSRNRPARRVRTTTLRAPARNTAKR